MGTDAGDRMILYHRHTVAHFQGAQPVRYHNDCPAFAEVLNGLINFHLIFRVRGACRFVQNQDGSIFQDRPCNSNPLFFPTGETGAEAAYLCVITIRQRHDEVINLRLPGGSPYFLQAGV